MIERREYSAGAVKMSFWFMEFLKVVGLLASGKSFDEVRKLNREENAFREILLNAVVHKDYNACNPIQISVYEDKIYLE